MAEHNEDTAEQAHDVLAAEEFAVPAPDPRLEDGRPHDVLAAEEFGLGAPDPNLRHAQDDLELPPDPYDPAGVEPAHDVLAAEEFAVPAPEPHAVPPEYGSGASARRAKGRSRLYAAVAAVATGVVFRRRLKRRRRSDA